MSEVALYLEGRTHHGEMAVWPGDRIQADLHLLSTRSVCRGSAYAIELVDLHDSTDSRLPLEARNVRTGVPHSSETPTP